MITPTMFVEFKRNRRHLPALIGLMLVLVSNAVAQDQSNKSRESGANPSLIPSSMRLASNAIRASTVTIRVDRTPTDEIVQRKLYPDRKPTRARRSVAVFSGVLVKQGIVVTPLFLPHAENPKVRITLPNGRQAEGNPRLLDEYSGLAIITIDDLTIPSLKCCEATEPVVGDWVVSGAAWGRQDALVSLGMISGIGYRLPKSSVEPPPMIVCDLRAAQTSKGAGVVAANGKLIGIVMAVSEDQKWTYVVPSCHIHRLLRILAQHDQLPAARTDEILVLKRQVPRIGVRINNAWNESANRYDIIVASVEKNGPADQGGLQKGDRIASVNGKAIRAWYDVSRDFYNRQPGDKIDFTVEREGKETELTIVLGGGYSASGENLFRLKEYIKPEIEIDSIQAESLPGRSAFSSQFSPLVRHSIHNLSPCQQNSALVDELLHQLESERAENQRLKSRVQNLEDRFDQLLKRIDSGKRP